MAEFDPRAESEHWETGVEERAAAPLPAPRNIRRSPRKVVAIPVWLRREERGRIWEEETETRVLSRYGALVDCRRYVETGGTLSVVRRDTGRRATARVTYGQFGSSGRRELGIEFLGCDNFWDVDWDTVVESDAAAADAAPESSDASQETAAAPHSGVAEPEPAAGIESAAAPASAPQKLSRAERKRVRIEETLTAAVRCLWDALQAGDRTTLDELLGAELVSISARGITPGAHDLEAPAGDAALDDFRVTPLNKTTALVTFLALDPQARLAYHSSLWLLRGGRWQLVFHQQTPAA